MTYRYRLDLPWTAPPLSLNDRGHWRVKAKKTAEVRDTARLLAKSTGLPTGVAHATVQLVYRPRDRRRRDPINLTATQKACVDGLVDHGLVVDDDRDHVTDLMPMITDPFSGQPGGMWLLIETKSDDFACLVCGVEPCECGE